LRYAERRERFIRAMGSGVAVLPAAPVALRNGDVEHEYRQDSDLYYLTGFDEPDAVAVLTATGPGPRFVLFCRTRDPEREVWDGPRAGVDGAVGTFGADEAHPIGELAEKLPKLLENVGRLYYRLGRDRHFDDAVFRVLERLRALSRRGIYGPTEIVDLGSLLHEMRLRKSEDEIAAMRHAGDITAKGHLQAMAAARPGRYEYEVEGVLRHAFRAGGSDRSAYPPIVGSGPNATILHYRRNDRRMEDGDLLLIDAGAEWGYMASDVTRTFPISGRFTDPQKAIYEIVLDAQQASIEATKPGATLEDVHTASVRVVTEGLVRLGIVSGDVPKVIEDGGYKTYYMHRTSHWIGMDVHDVGAYHVDGKPRPLEPGMALTIEPGIYLAPTADVDARFRGIGVRIEDDVVVRDLGCEVLTSSIPKTVADVEAAVRG
jgi:Xaa-Pro aminopeptidase